MTAKPSSAPSTQRAKRNSKDDRFARLLRRHCLRAALVGAGCGVIEALPGFAHRWRRVFGEIADARQLHRVQRELVEETFALYGFNLPAPLRQPLVAKVQRLGAGAGLASEALFRTLLTRLLGRLGTTAARAMPLLPIVSAASTNTLVTYAIGKRAQAVARLGQAPLASAIETLRTLTGTDERRIAAWSTAALQSIIERVGRIGRTLPRKPDRRLRSRRAVDR
jgi:hypothetical protein